MALGEQFNNTYWLKDAKTDGGAERMGFSLAGGTDPHRVIKGEDTERGAGRLIDIASAELGRYPQPPLQGMLFDPHTGTGLKQDPLIPIERRSAAIDAALRLNEGREILKRGHADLLRNSLMDSQMTTPEIESIKPVRAYLDNKVRSSGGTFSRYNRKLMVKQQTKKTQERVPGKVIAATLPSDTPIFNDKFSDQFIMKVPEAESLFASDVEKAAKSGERILWHNPETGETITNDEAVFRHGRVSFGPDIQIVTKGKPYQNEHGAYVMKYTKREDYDPEKHGPLSALTNDKTQDVYISDRGGVTDPHYYVGESVDAGFVPNLFFGKGVAPDNPKIHSEPSFSAERGYMNSRGDYPTVEVHTRFVPDKETVEERLPDTVVTRRTHFIQGSTLTHELGHATDMADDRIGRIQQTQKYLRDPMSEGRADAFADVYSRSADRLSSTLRDPADTAADLIKTGYTTKNSSWQNKTSRALYAATRIHTRMGGMKTQHPSREMVMEHLGMTGRLPDANTVDRLTLGFMMEHAPHVRQHLGLGDFAETATASHQEYLDTHREYRRQEHNKWARERGLTEIPAEPPEQLDLFDKKRSKG